MKNVLVQFRRRYLIFRSRKCQKHESRRYPRFTPLCPLKFEFRKMLKLVFRYLYEECFNTIPKTISYFAVENISRTLILQIAHFNPLKSTLCAPWNSNLEKCRNRFLGICMKNVLVQFRKWYLLLRSRKSQKRECQNTPVLPFKIKILCPFKFEFGKMQNTLFGYLHGQCFSNLQFRQPVSYFAAEKISKTLMSQILRFNALKSILCAPWNSNLEKLRNWFLGNCMKNALVEFRKRYFILQPRKCRKREFRKYPRFNPLCPIKFEFGKMQKLVFRYLYEECLSTFPRMVSYFAAEKL